MFTTNIYNKFYYFTTRLCEKRN